MLKYWYLFGNIQKRIHFARNTIMAGILLNDWILILIDLRWISIEIVDRFSKSFITEISLKYSLWDAWWTLSLAEDINPIRKYSNYNWNRRVNPPRHPLRILKYCTMIKHAQQDVQCKSCMTDSPRIFSNGTKLPNWTLKLEW